MMYQVPEIHWAAWGRIMFLPLALIALAILGYAFIKRRKGIACLSSGNWPFPLIVNYSHTKATAKMGLFLLGFLLLLVGLLQPQWNKREQTMHQEGRDVLIAFDVSRSMLAQDYKPSRLEFAKKKVRSLLSLLKCERVGLILYSGSAFVQCPLTSDYNAFFMFLDQLDAQTITSGSTAMDAALAKAIDVFGKTPERKHKLVIVLTDGEDFSSNLAGLRQRAQQIGMTIFTLGIGTPEGAPIPLMDEQGKQAGHQLDTDGSVVISRLNEGILSALATSAGGIYLKATYDDNDIQSLVDKVHSFEKEWLEDKKFSVYDEGYPYVLATGLLCLMIEWIL